MNPGELRYKIEFGKFKNETDTEGFKKPQWAPDFGTWASVSNLYGREFWAAKAVQGETTIKFKCRYNSRINENLCIRFQGNYYEIIPPVDDIKYLHREMEIKAKILERERV